MIAASATVIVVAVLLFVRWIVVTLRDADRRAGRFEVDWRSAEASRKQGEIDYAKLDRAHQELRRRYVELARKAVVGLSDEELAHELGAGAVGDRLLDPFAEGDRGPGPDERAALPPR